MLANAKVEPTIPVTNLEQAKKFYSETLGFKVASIDIPGHTRLECGSGTTLVIYQRGPSKADHTLANFTVENLESEMSELKGKGIQFEEYDFPGLKTLNGVATFGSIKSAWFKDPDGNILGITQES